MSPRALLRAVVSVAAASLLFASFSTVSGAGVSEKSYLHIVKAVVGTAPEGAEYTIVVQCQNGNYDTGPLEYKVNGPGAVTTVDLEFGAVPDSFGGDPVDCTVSEPVTAGATASFACETPDAGDVTCDPTGSAVNVVDLADLEATITVTNTFAPPPPPPVATGPSFTG